MVCVYAYVYNMYIYIYIYTHMHMQILCSHRGLLCFTRASTLRLCRVEWLIQDF